MTFNTSSFSRRALLAAVGLSTAAWLNPVRAQLAGKPVTLIVSSAAGGTTDISARMLAEPLGRILQASVIVDNRAGANGNIAGQMVARGPTDGSMLLVQYSGYQCITPLIQPVPGFDPATSLKPLGHLLDAPQVLVVRANFPADNFADFLKYVKAHPGQVNYASSGNGSLQHVTTELLKDLTKTYMVHIPYRGTGPALNDLLAGTVDFTITTPPPLLAQIRAGKLKALMVTGRARLAALPNIPTATEAGVPLVASSWFAVYGPSGMSAELQNRLSLAIGQVVEADSFKKRAEDQGAKAIVMSSTELSTLEANERKMWARIVKVANIKAD